MAGTSTSTTTATKLSHSMPTSKDKLSKPDTTLYARANDGSLFAVPPTTDMVTQLFSPTAPKNHFDLLILSALALQIALFFYLPATHTRTLVFGALFAFWRIAYNGGLGYLLHLQYTTNRLVDLFQNTGVHLDPESGRSPHPRLHAYLAQQLGRTMRGTGYALRAAPPAFTAWLLFRRLADLVLMSDFTAYVLFALSARRGDGGPAAAAEEATTQPIAGPRHALAAALVALNAWAKVDAHRVVRDYNWYWGDFFFLVRQDLAFDGVFRLTANPMYTLGYAGYYGVALAVGGWRVWGLSVAAHAAQMAFLYLVEEPFFRRTYCGEGEKGE